MGKEETVQSPPQNILSLLRSYSRKLYELDEKPLLDQTFSFPWSECSEAISKTFGVEITLLPEKQKWRDKSDLYEGLVAPTLPLAFSLPGVDGYFFLAISRSDVELVMKESLQVSTEQLLEENKKFFDQFWLFFRVELCCAALSITSLKTLSPRLTTESEDTEEGYFCLDISLGIAGQHSLTRLFLPPKFLKSWKALRTSPSQEEPVLKNIPLQVSVEAGRTFVASEDLSSFQVGDVILLQHPFFIPESEKSRVFLTHGGKPLFRAKLQDDGIKILEMPLQHEAFIPLGELSMANKKPLQEEPEEHLTEGITEIEHEEHVTEGITEAEAEETHAEETEEDPFKEEEEKETPPPTEEELKELSKKSTMLSDKPLRLQDIPLSVIVQLTELTMKMGELAALQPGSLVNLDIVPENGVALVINERIIARGELIKIGDNVGVRLQEIDLQQ
jgi:flagellar motor switch protein FliN